MRHPLHWARCHLEQKAFLTVLQFYTMHCLCELRTMLPPRRLRCLCEEFSFEINRSNNVAGDLVN